MHPDVFPINEKETKRVVEFSCSHECHSPVSFDYFCGVYDCGLCSNALRYQPKFRVPGYCMGHTT
ncbi:hypothetical protein DESC_390050 [Desulfosarcina cetonica]|nr:hypothetical protein DESC_390050 [Desulfosarcina cetonica]